MTLPIYVPAMRPNVKGLPTRLFPDSSPPSPHRMALDMLLPIVNGPRDSIARSPGAEAGSHGYRGGHTTIDPVPLTTRHPAGGKPSIFNMPRSMRLGPSR